MSPDPEILNLKPDETRAAAKQYMQVSENIKALQQHLSLSAEVKQGMPGSAIIAASNSLEQNLGQHLRAQWDWPLGAAKALLDATGKITGQDEENAAGLKLDFDPDNPSAKPGSDQKPDDKQPNDKPPEQPPTDQSHDPVPQAPAPGDVTADQLQKIEPALSPEKAKQYAPLLNQSMREAGITTPQEKAMYIAQLAHESDHFKTFEEYDPGWRYDPSVNPAKAAELGNTEKGDGPKYHGRGAIQVTGKSNYTKCGQALGLDLVNHPELLEQPENAFKASAWYWSHSGHGVHEAAVQGDFREVTRRINGGYNGMDDRQALYQRAQQALGVQ